LWPFESFFAEYLSWKWHVYALGLLRLTVDVCQSRERLAHAIITVLCKGFGVKKIYALIKERNTDTHIENNRTRFSFRRQHESALFRCRALPLAMSCNDLNGIQRNNIISSQKHIKQKKFRASVPSRQIPVFDCAVAICTMKNALLVMSNLT
jgi:hypothetical protein